MNTALAKKPASVLRAYTEQVRNHAGAMQRLQDQYFAALRRAEAQYFEGSKRINEAVFAAAAESGVEPEPEPVQAEPAAVAS